VTITVPDLLVAVTLDHDLLEAVEAGDPIWTLDELRVDFAVLAERVRLGYVVVERRCDHTLGTVRFTRRQPRFFWGWKELTP
jgi:hypothetical protein